MAGPDLRVSDAERTEVADVLSKHFAEGRLDQAEFDERLQRAMGAKTRADLSGLLGDLPPLVPPPPPPSAHRHRGRAFAFWAVLFLFFAALTSGPWTWQWHFPWVLAAVVLFLLWRRSRRHWHSHHRPAGRWHGPLPPPGSGEAGPWAYGRRGWWV